MLFERIAETPEEATRLKALLTPNVTTTNSSASVPSVAPAGGVGAAAGAWDTAANRDAAIASINALRTLASDLQTKLNALQTELRTRQIIK